MATPLSPALRKLVLTAHVTSSVGWLGAVAVFLVLAITGLASQDALTVHAYLAMELTAWCVVVPLSIAAPFSGVILSLGTAWGLFRHFWVVAKLVITVPSTILLFLHLQPIGHLARVVAETTLAHGHLTGLRLQLVADAGAATVVLLVAPALSVYKPRGIAWYAQRRQYRQGCTGEAPGYSVARPVPPWAYVGILAIIVVSLFVIQHLAGAGHRH